jgi:hypothetical protein
MTATKTVIFADGSILTGETWREMELALREESWNESDKGSFRREMAQRAWNWSEHAMHEDASSYRFFRELEEGGLCTIVNEEGVGA